MEYWIIFVVVTIFIDVIMFLFAYEKGYKNKTEEYKSELRKIAFELGLDLDGDVFMAVNTVNKRGYMVWICIDAELGIIHKSVSDNKSSIENFNSIFIEREESK